MILKGYIILLLCLYTEKDRIKECRSTRRKKKMTDYRIFYLNFRLPFIDLLVCLFFCSLNNINQPRGEAFGYLFIKYILMVFHCFFFFFSNLQLKFNNLTKFETFNK